MSDVIVIMNGGVIQQTGTPVEVYDEPDNRFVADFIGESNIFDGIYRKDGSRQEKGLVEFAGDEWISEDHGFESGPVDETITDAIAMTMFIAVMSAMIATLFGTCGAIGISCMRYKNIVISVSNIPLLNADIVTGVSMMLVFARFFTPGGDIGDAGAHYF